MYRIQEIVWNEFSSLRSWRDSCARGTFFGGGATMRSERRSREGKSDFKLTCIPTLLAAPPRKQYSTSTLIPPARQAMNSLSRKDVLGPLLRRDSYGSILESDHFRHWLFSPYAPQALYGLSDLLVRLCFCFVIFEGICIKAETASLFELKNPIQSTIPSCAREAQWVSKTIADHEMTSPLDYSQLPVTRTLDNLNLPLTRSKFLFPFRSFSV